MARKKHILMLTSDPHILDRRIYQQAKYLVKDGFRVTIAYTTDNLVLPEEKVPELVFLNRKLHGTSGQRNGRAWKAWEDLRSFGAQHVFMIRLYQFLVAVFRDTSESWKKKLLAYDWPESEIVVCHDVPLLPTALALKQKEITKKVLLDAHEIFDAQYDAIYSSYARKYWSGICNKFKPECDAITTVTKDIAQEMSNRFSLPVEPEVVQNSYPFREYTTLKRNLLRALYGIPDNQKIVLCMGELRPGRNLEELVHSMVFLNDSNIALVFLGAGSQSYIDRLKRVSTKLRLSSVYAGKEVNPSLVVDYAADADLGIITNRGLGPNNLLGGPNRLYEYIQARIPILSYEHTGVRKIIDQTQTGATTSWSDPKELADFVLSWIDFKQSNQDKLERAAKAVNWESDYKTYLSVINQLLA